MKKRGFTLIELIVVIAIVGILAAILIPAMMGYVRKAKISTANSAAKSLYNGANVAMVEMEAYDLPPQKLQGDITTTGSAVFAQKDLKYEKGTGYSADELTCILYAKICQYFSDVYAIDSLTLRLKGYGCVACGVVQGKYPGSYPQKIEASDYLDHDGSWTSALALEYAVEGEEQAQLGGNVPVEGGD